MDTHGYVTDFLCYDNYFMSHNPHWLRFAAITQNKPINTEANFNYCEVGCGHGQTIAINAAANPQAQFYGLDIIEGHHASMLEYKRLLGIDNFHPIHCDIMEPPELPKMDFIIAHGFISWVVPEVIAGLVEFIDQHLKPGGLVMLSFDSLPGCAHREQIAHIIQRHIRNTPDLKTGIQKSIEYMVWLYNNKSYMFTMLTLLKTEMESLSGSLDNVVHRYGNGVYVGHHFEDVNSIMNDIGLLYAGNVNIHRNHPSLCLKSEVVSQLPVTSVVQREIIMQELLNIPFSVSLFHKPSNDKITDPNSISVTNALPRPYMHPEGNTPLGDVSLDKKIGGLILNLLEKPQVISSIPFSPSVVHTLIALCEYVLPVADASAKLNIDPKPFVEACLRGSSALFVAFPSSVLGTGVGVPSEIACVLLMGSISKAEELAKELDKPWSSKVNKALAPDVKKYRDHLKRLGAWKR